MRPLYFADYAEDKIYETLLAEVAWTNRDAPRDECFMSLVPLSYTYGKGDHARTYSSLDFHPEVLRIMNAINSEFDSAYDVCFLNYYRSEKEHLGWHADNSPDMDSAHPIAVVSFGAPRYIWVKPIDNKGNVPDEDKFLLGDGSLFIMPKGFQDSNLHKIPKNDRPCGGRISLTFRKFKGK